MRLALILALLASPATAQTVSLTHPAPLAPGIAAFPKVIGHSRTARNINAALADNDADVKGSDCRAAPNFYTERSIEVTLAGPHYLAFLITDGWYCPSSAHPGSATSPLIFSLTNGDYINPQIWLPRALRPDAHLNRTEGQTTQTTPLTDLYLNLAKPDPAAQDDPNCTEILQTVPHGFILWPDASKHALILQPSGLPYIFTACLNPVALPVAQLLKQHASPRLIAALTGP
jgi:hypothetical protein